MRRADHVVKRHGMQLAPHASLCVFLIATYVSDISHWPLLFLRFAPCLKGAPLLLIQAQKSPLHLDYYCLQSFVLSSIGSTYIPSISDTMPLYELVCIAQRFKASTSQAVPLQALLKETSTFVHHAGGCVRRLDYHGLQALPQRARKDGQWHDRGDLWTMWFDTNPRVLDQLHRQLRTDPRVLRYTTIKKGETLSQVTTALPVRPDKTQQGARHDMTAPSEVSVSSLYSSNDSFPRMVDYMPIMHATDNLQEKHDQGTTSRAEEEALLARRQGSRLAPRRLRTPEPGAVSERAPQQQLRTRPTSGNGAGTPHLSSSSVIPTTPPQATTVPARASPAQASRPSTSDGGVRELRPKPSWSTEQWREAGTQMGTYDKQVCGNHGPAPTPADLETADRRKRAFYDARDAVHQTNSGPSNAIIMELQLPMSSVPMFPMGDLQRQLAMGGFGGRSGGMFTSGTLRRS